MSDSSVVGVLAEALATKLTEKLGWEWKGARFEDVCIRGGSMDIPSGEHAIRELAESLASVVTSLPEVAVIDITQQWFVLRDGWFSAGGKQIAGPFTTRDDALTAREALEHSEGHSDYWVDSGIAQVARAAGGQA